MSRARLTCPIFLTQMGTQDRLKRRYKKVTLSPKFAEPVTFTPVLDKANPRTVWMSITPRVSAESQDRTEKRMEIAECFFLTDETDPDKGGIQTPITSDSFVRDASFDPDTRPFVFNGTVLEHGQHYWRVEFQRTSRIGQQRGN